LERLRGLVARERLERARDDVGLPDERAVGRLQLVSALEAQPEPAELLNELQVLLVGEPLGDRLGPVRAEALDLLDVFLARRSERIDRAKVRREVPRGDPADL